MGVIEYSQQASILMGLGEYQYVGAVQDKLDTLQRSGRSTYTGRALNLTAEEFFKTADRADAVNHVILLTDGKAHGTYQTEGE